MPRLLILTTVTAGLLALGLWAFLGRGDSPPVGGSPEGPPLELFNQMPIGNPFDSAPQISYVDIQDLDADGMLDVIVCDCTNHSVSWIRQGPLGEFTEQILLSDFPAPARVETVDFDQDGDLDLFVAVLGQLFPTNDHIGALVALENDGQQNFTQRTLLQDVARVSDVRACDVDQDQDLDLIVTQFGYNDGQVQILENLGDWKFSGRTLQSKAGGIHGIPADFNADGLPDIAVLVSQETEAIYVFFGTGGGEFRESEIYAAGNPDFGSAGIWVVDFDQDGDQDLLYCNGDAFDYSPPRPWPWHGVQWLENMNDGQDFQYHRLANFGGAVNAQAVDYDGDGDLDVFVASAFNDWHSPASQSLRLLSNTGSISFLSHPLANSPSHIQALALGDLNQDGRIDLVTGGMHISAPYDRVDRVTLWLGNDSIPQADVDARPH